MCEGSKSQWRLFPAHWRAIHIHCAHCHAVSVSFYFFLFHVVSSSRPNQRFMQKLCCSVAVSENLCRCSCKTAFLGWWTAWLLHLSLGFKLFTVSKEVSWLPTRKRHGNGKKFQSMSQNLLVISRLNWSGPPTFIMLICWKLAEQTMVICLRIFLSNLV